jgi:hypothetical protein
MTCKDCDLCYRMFGGFYICSIGDKEVGVGLKEVHPLGEICESFVERLDKTN